MVVPVGARSNYPRNRNKEAHMIRGKAVVISLAVICCAVATPTVVARNDDRRQPPTGLVREVRLGTADFRDLTVAMAAGYSSTDSCISGPEEGAMGIHFANWALIDNPALDSQNPEFLVYEQRGGRLRLVGVEFMV